MTTIKNDFLFCDFFSVFLYGRPFPEKICFERDHIDDVVFFFDRKIKNDTIFFRSFFRRFFTGYIHPIIKRFHISQILNNIFPAIYKNKYFISDFANKDLNKIFTLLYYNICVKIYVYFVIFSV